MKVIFWSLIVIQILAIVLKHIEIINWSWWLVFIPIYPIILFLIICGIYLILLVN